MKPATVSLLVFVAGLRSVNAAGNVDTSSVHTSSTSQYATTSAGHASSSSVDVTPTTTLSSRTSSSSLSSSSSSWSDWTTGTCIPSTIRETVTVTTKEIEIVTQPPVTVTEPPVTVTEPLITVTVPPVTVTAPPITKVDTITQPPVTITEPGVTGPFVTVTQTPVTETLGEVTSTITSTETVVVESYTTTETQTTTQITTIGATTSTLTETETINNVETITDIETITAIPTPVTVVSISTVFQTQTIVDTATIATTASITNEVTATITTISATTAVVTVSTCATPLDGIVTCPTRIINPTYTPPAPLPSDYLWGCPPGKLCRPKREGCNFEQNPPAGSYFCAPEECLPVAQLPPLETWLDFENVNDTCAWLTPIDDYFNINPTFLDLDFDIFNIYGQETCSAAAPASTLTVTVANTVIATWAEWTASTTGAVQPQITKRAELSERNVEKRAIAVASQCYALCDYAAAVYQSVGQIPELCATDGQWSSALARVTSCTEKYSATGVMSVATVLNDPILYCRRNPTKRSIFGRRVPA